MDLYVLLYVLFAVAVASYKTDYYIHVENVSQFENATLEQIRGIYRIVFLFTLVIAPLTFIELLFMYVKSKVLKGINYFKIKIKKIRRKNYE